MIRSYPLLTLVVSLALLTASAWAGAVLSERLRADKNVGDDFSLVRNATLTILGLIIGFSFAMAISRYDQRKDYEEEEANAIGTEFARAELLPAADAVKVRALLRSYLDERIRFYTEVDETARSAIDARTADLQAQLWAAVRAPAVAQQTPIHGIVVIGMNDVVNRQGYVQAAWLNRIPAPAWWMMAAMAIFSNALIGFGAKSRGTHPALLWVLPVVVAVAFWLIAELDSPLRGTVRIEPHNLLILSRSLSE